MAAVRADSVAGRTAIPLTALKPDKNSAEVNVQLIAIVMLALAGVPLANAGEPVPQKAVLITGASSGIGRVTAEHLAAHGWYVYAGARKAADMEALNRIDNIEAVRLDVTIQADVDAAVEQVREGGRGLWGLINNAGVATFGPTPEMPVEDMEWMFDVNVIGVHRVTSAFTPLIAESRGRIINISSVSGFGAAPYAAGYAASKHAVEAYTDSLAELLAEVGVRVIAIEPGNFVSSIGVGHCRRMLASEDDYAESLFDYTKTMLEWCRKHIVTGRYEDGATPEIVAETIEQALSVPKPRPRYLVFHPDDRGAAEWTIRAAVWELAGLAFGAPAGIDRDRILGWLDEEMLRIANGEALVTGALVSPDDEDE